MTWVPLHCHSHYSFTPRLESSPGALLDALSKPSQIVDRCVELGYSACALTDHASISGGPDFLKVCAKKKVRGIVGCEFYVCEKDAADQSEGNKQLTHLTVLAKNREGWKALIKACSLASRPEYALGKPRLDLERLAALAAGNLFVFSGHPGTHLANLVFKEPQRGYAARTYEEAKALADPERAAPLTLAVRRLQELFGESNFFLEIFLADSSSPAFLGIANTMRWLSKKLGVPKVAMADPHYCRKEDAPDHRMLLCSAMGSTLAGSSQMASHTELGVFFKSNAYHLPSMEEMKFLHTQDELDLAGEIAEQIEPFDVGSRPLIPSFPCPTNVSADKYLEVLCMEGWTKLITPVVQGDKEKRRVYIERIQRELSVLFEAGLSDYFLIVWDYIRYVSEVLGRKVGTGRGSAAGSLVSYLIGITRRADPVKFGLLFERFYNAGRNQPGRIALPDIDTDFSVQDREKIINYLRIRYGEAHVCQMATFSRLQGKASIKEVFRIHGRSFEDANRISEFIPDEAEINDELQEMREEGLEASILRWALDNNAKKLSEWVSLKEDGGLEGPYALEFEQAMRLEGTFKNVSKHASGVIVCSEKIADICPMSYDKTTKSMALAIDMKVAEMMGLVKFDILGLATLDRIQAAENFVRMGRAC